MASALSLQNICSKWLKMVKEYVKQASEYNLWNTINDTSKKGLPNFSWRQHTPVLGNKGYSGLYVAVNTICDREEEYRHYSEINDRRYIV